MLAPGTVIDSRYEILAPLAGGGMGQVYRARRTLLGDEVAVKVMQGPIGSPDDEAALRERFLRESRACAQLHHPHIVTILDFNIDPTGRPYMVMELLTGPSLREELALVGPMEPADVVAILRPVAAALQIAHEHGITHRDLKPANIVAHRYESGERVYKVIDFGLASIAEAVETTRLTQPNMFLGTLAYAAPEQLNGEHPDPRTDIYALGVIVYEMLTGRRPFDGDTGPTLIQQTLVGTPPGARSRRPGLSHDIDAAVMRALARNRQARWAKVTEFVQALERASGGTERAAGSRDALLARYELGEMVGHGRLGSRVYRGRHRALGIDVAVRVLRREEQPHWDAVRTRFLMEARTLQVAHPNLLQVRDYGEDEHVLFVVTDYVDGPSLRQEVVRTPQFPWARAANLLAQMLDATAALNARGGFVVGVNPDMIRLAGGGAAERVVMSTAGIHSVHDVLAAMREQELRGEAADEQELPFVAPEVLMGQAPSPSADVFTLGVLAYLMITGALPFRAPSVPELLGQMLQSTPASPRSINSEIPEAASEAIGRALHPQPAERFQTALEFRASVLA